MTTKDNNNSAINKQAALDNLAYLSCVEIGDGTILDTQFYGIVKLYIQNSQPIPEAKTLEDIEEKISKCLNDLEIHEWIDGGKFQEIRDIEYCKNSILDSCKQYAAQVIGERAEKFEDIFPKLTVDLSNQDKARLVTVFAEKDAEIERLKFELQNREEHYNDFKTDKSRRNAELKDENKRLKKLLKENNINF